MASPRVNIEYSQLAGFEPRFRLLEQEIKRAIPQANVTGFVGRPNAFEVALNDQLIFSRLQNGDFPDNSMIIQQLKQGLQGGLQQGGFQQGNVPVQGLGAAQAEKPSLLTRLMHPIASHEAEKNAQLAGSQQQPIGQSGISQQIPVTGAPLQQQQQQQQQQPGWQAGAQQQPGWQAGAQQQQQPGWQASAQRTTAFEQNILDTNAAQPVVVQNAPRQEAITQTQYEKPITQVRYEKPVVQTTMGAPVVQQTTYQPIKQTTYQPVVQTTYQPVVQTSYQPMDESTTYQPVSQTVIQQEATTVQSGVPQTTTFQQQPIAQGSSFQQQPLGQAAIGQPALGQTGLRRQSSSSSSSSDDAEKLQQKQAGTYVKERRAKVDRPGMTADQKHNLDVDQIRGASHLRRENVREQT